MIPYPHRNVSIFTDRCTAARFLPFFAFRKKSLCQRGNFPALSGSSHYS
ncbi:MAG: hypothetical protein ABSG49_06780 [Methanoregula sp.]